MRHRRPRHRPLGEPIEATTIERAIVIGEYYTAHALAAFGLMETEGRH
ncbi:hypothetical protein [Streptomyces sp. NPDC040750]